MKKAKKMTEVKTQKQTETAKKPHITLVKPAPVAMSGGPGVGCRPTGVQ